MVKCAFCPALQACLPIPGSTGEPIPWGIIPIDLSIVIHYDNLTKGIAKTNITHYLDEEEKCWRQGDGLLNDPIAWRPRDNRIIFGKEKGKEYTKGS